MIRTKDDSAQCECGSTLFTRVQELSHCGSTNRTLVPTYQCCACGVIHRLLDMPRFGTANSWERLEFNGADGAWKLVES
jgi:hypothetical protein